MKTKFKITIEADVEYPGMKFTEKMQKAFDDWLIKFSTNPDTDLHWMEGSPIPVIFDEEDDEPGVQFASKHGERITVSHHADAKIKVIIEKEDKVFFQKEWDDIGNPYGD